MSLNKFSKGLGWYSFSLWATMVICFTDANTRYMILGLRNRILTSMIQNLVLAQYCWHSPSLHGPLPEGSCLMLCIVRVSITAEHQSWKRIVFRTSLSICSLSAVITSSLKGEYPWERDQIKSSQSLRVCPILQEDSGMLKTHNRLLQPNILPSNLISEMLRSK